MAGLLRCLGFTRPKINPNYYNWLVALLVVNSIFLVMYVVDVMVSYVMGNRTQEAGVNFPTGWTEKKIDEEQVTPVTL